MNILKAIGKPFTALAGKVDHTVETKILASLARHAAGALGGFLLAHGLIAASSASSVEDAIGTLLVAIATGSAVKQKVEENTL